MARPKTFDQDEAIKGATEIFWRQGFKATSLPDLLEAMNMTRGSFYLAFDTKQNVYSLAMDYYDQYILDSVISMLDARDQETPWERLAPLFQNKFEDRRGCFICNAMVELGPENQDVANKATHMATKLRKAVERVLAKSEEAWDPKRVQDCADLIIRLYFGNQAYGRAGYETTGWEAALKGLLALYSGKETAT